MTVRIPVTADAQSVTKSLTDIQNALRRAGQEGKAFAEIDLSHPEVARLAADIQKLRENLEALVKVGRGATADAFRIAVGAPTMAGAYSPRYDGSALSPTGIPGYLDAMHRQFGNPATAARVTAQATSFIMQGIPGHVPAAPAAPAPAAPHPSAPSAPAATPGAASGLTGMITAGAARILGPVAGAAIGSALGPIGTGVGFLAGMEGARTIGGMVRRSIEQAENEARANDQLYRTLRDVDGGFSTLRDQVRETARGFGGTFEEAQRFTLSWARLTNETDSGRATDMARFAGSMARGYGVSGDAVVQGLGRAQYAGEDPRRFAAIVAETVQRGQMTGRVEQVMDSLVRWSETASRQMATENNVGLFAGMMAHMTASGNPGLRANAEGILHQLNQASISGGMAGEASQYLAYRALARHGVTDVFEQQLVREGGMFEQINGPNTPTVLEALWGETNRMYEGMPHARRQVALGRQFGLSARVIRDLEKAYGHNLGGLVPQLRGAGVNLAELDGGSMRDFAQIGTANAEGLDRFRTRFLANSGDRLPSDLRRQIEGASGEDLRNALLRGAAVVGRERTEGSDMVDSMNRWSNALTQTGTGFLPVMTDLRNVLSTMGEGVGAFSDVMHDVILALHGDQEALARLRGGAQPTTGPVNSPAAQEIRRENFGGRGGAVYTSPETLRQLEAEGYNTTGLQPGPAAAAAAARERWGGLRITSGFRSPAHNAAVGGAPGSRHTHGDAVDLDLSGVPEGERAAVLEYFRQQGATGYGMYGPNSTQAHIDWRPGQPTFWGPTRRSGSLGQTPGYFQDFARGFQAVPQAPADWSPGGFPQWWNPGGGLGATPVPDGGATGGGGAARPGGQQHGMRFGFDDLRVIVQLPGGQTQEHSLGLTNGGAPPSWGNA